MSVERVRNNVVEKPRADYEQWAIEILEKRMPDPEQVAFTPEIDFLDPESRLTREQLTKVAAMGDRTATRYSNLTQRVLNEPPERTEQFHQEFTLKAGGRPGHIAHTSIEEGGGIGPSERSGDRPFAVEGISSLVGLLYIGSLRHFSLEFLSSRGAPMLPGYYTIRKELVGAGLEEPLRERLDEIFSIYHELVFTGLQWFLENEPILLGEEEQVWRYEWRALSMALDQARGVLPMAVNTHGIMHANNLLALEEGLTALLSSELPETREVAQRILDVSAPNAPVLLKYVGESGYTESLPEKRKKIRKRLNIERDEAHPGQEVETTVLPFRLEAMNRGDVGDIFLAAFAAQGARDSLGVIREKVARMPDAEKRRMAEMIFSGLNTIEKPPPELEVIQIQVQMSMTIGGYLELLRHRLITDIAGEFTIEHGFYVPEFWKREFPEMADKFRKAIRLSEEAYQMVHDLGPDFYPLDDYFVTRAHFVPTTVRMSGLDVFHIMKLRASEGAHPFDIRDPMRAVMEEIKHRWPIPFDYVVFGKE